MMIFARAVAAALACIVLYTLLRIHWHEERIQNLEDRVLGGLDADSSDENDDAGAAVNDGAANNDDDDDGANDDDDDDGAANNDGAAVKCDSEADGDAVRIMDTPDDAIVVVTEAVVEHGENEEEEENENEEENRKEEEDEEPPVLSGFQRIQRRRAEMASDLRT